MKVCESGDGGAHGMNVAFRMLDPPCLIHNSCLLPHRQLRTNLVNRPRYASLLELLAHHIDKSEEISIVSYSI